MAKIPSLSDSGPRVRQADPITPTLGAREAAAPFNQIGNLADQVSSSMFQLQKKQQIEADKVSYTKSNIEFSKSFNDISSQMQEEYRSPDKANYEGFSTDGVARMKERKQEILDASPESTRANISLSFDQKMVDMERRFKSKEASNKSQYALVETNNMIDDAAKTSYSSYSPLSTFEETRRLKSLISGSGKYDEKGKAVLQNRINNISKDMLNGVLDREDPSEMRMALSDLEQRKDDPVFSEMDPRILEKSELKLKRKLEYKNGLGNRELKGKVRDSIAGLTMGTLSSSNPEDRKILDNVKNEAVTRMGEEGEEFVNKIETAEKISEIAREGAFNINQIDEKSEAKIISEGLADPLKRAGSEARSIKLLQDQKRSMQRELKKDPASYIMKNDSSVAQNAQEMISSNSPDAFKEMMNSMDSRYDQLGVTAGQRKYLPAPLKEHYGGSIKKFIESNDHQSAATMMNELAIKTNGDLYRVYDELGLPAKYAGVAEIQDPDARIRVMGHVMNEATDINPRYKDNDNKLDDSTINTNLRENDFYKSIMSQDAKTNSNAGNQAEGLLGVAKVEYKLAILNGSSEDEAKEEAWSAVSKNYDIVENGQLPIAINNQKHNSEKLKFFIDSNTKMDMDYVNKFNLKVHDGASMSATNSQYKSNSSWTYNRKSDSIRLVVHENGSWKGAEDINGKPVLIPVSEIDNMDDLTESKVQLERRKKIFGVGGVRGF